jgi:hypothetical protein
MSIKDTSGIKQYLQDQGRAEILVLDIKSNNKSKETQTFKKAETLFNQAAGVGNGWMRGIVVEARLKKEVNVSVSDYRASDAGKRIASFLALDDAKALDPVSETKAFDPVSAVLIATVVVNVIDQLEKQNDARVDRAVQTIEREFSKSQWTTFELTTPEWVTNKYGSLGADK